MLANYSTSMYNDIQKVGAVVSIGRVGKVSANVISALNLSVAPDTPIYIGKANMVESRYIIRFALFIIVEAE